MTIEPILDAFCPFHVAVSPSGHIVHAGRTIHKITLPDRVTGARFLEVFEVTRPKHISSVCGLRACAGRTLSLRLRRRANASFKGLVLPLDDGGFVVNMSFGISVIDAVRDYNLSAGDFSPTDLTIEMLYLVEAKSLAMEESRRLNLRLRRAMIAAEEQAFTDTLTGLKNRRALDHVLGRHLSSGKDFALMHLDLDFFKEINDSHGHAAGDLMLQHVAEAMLAETREQDTLARVGGDEFVILLSGWSPKAPVVPFGERLIRRIEAPVAYRGGELRVSASIGFVHRREVDPPSAEAMADAADRALYAAKRAGRSRIFRLCDVASDNGPDALRVAQSATRHPPPDPLRRPMSDTPAHVPEFSRKGA